MGIVQPMHAADVLPNSGGIKNSPETIQALAVTLFRKTLLGRIRHGQRRQWPRDVGILVTKSADTVHVIDLAVRHHVTRQTRRCIRIRTPDYPGDGSLTVKRYRKLRMIPKRFQPCCGIEMKRYVAFEVDNVLDPGSAHVLRQYEEAGRSMEPEVVPKLESKPRLLLELPDVRSIRKALRGNKRKSIADRTKTVGLTLIRN